MTDVTPPRTANIDAQKLNETVAWLGQRGPAPSVAVVLGSGLGAFADRLQGAVSHPYEQIPHAPRSLVAGHAGRLCVGDIAGARLAVLSGRVHAYEGHHMAEVAFLLRAVIRWGAARVLLTNAAGSVNLGFAPGDLMIITDHLNLTGRSPLWGLNDDAIGPRFVDMTRAYDPAFIALIREEGRAQGVALKEGVYAAMPGPQYETPAEIRMLRALGADAVGMSTVPEVIAARHMGARVAAISCITNHGAGITGAPLSHDEVKETADRVAATLIALLERVVRRLAA